MGLYIILQELQFRTVNPLTAFTSRVNIHDLVKLNFSLFCKLFLKLRQFCQKCDNIGEKNNTFYGWSRNFSLSSWLLITVIPFVMNIFIQEKWAEVMREDDSPLFLFWLQWHAYLYVSLQFSQSTKGLQFLTCVNVTLLLWKYYSSYQKLQRGYFCIRKNTYCLAL